MAIAIGAFGPAAGAVLAHAVTVHGPPTAAFTVSGANVAVGSPVSFDGSGSSEAGASITSYSWNFGDGTSAAGASTSHAYALPGTYTVTLTVTDPFGASASSSQTVMVSSVASAVIAQIGGQAIVGDPLSFSGASSQDTGSSLTGYRWSFGDGGHASGVLATYTYAKPGAYDVTLTVTDATGGMSTAAVPILVKAPWITRIEVRKGRRFERLEVTVNGPGVLVFRSRSFGVGRPRTITIKARLTRSQRDWLLVTDRLAIKLNLQFVPLSGRTDRRTVRIELKR